VGREVSLRLAGLLGVSDSLTWPTPLREACCCLSIGFRHTNTHKHNNKTKSGTEGNSRCERCLWTPHDDHHGAGNDSIRLTQTSLTTFDSPVTFLLSLSCPASPVERS